VTTKTVIAVRGQPDSGKSTAITLAYNEIAKAGTIIYSNPRLDATELKEVLELDGVIVGFASAGDKPDRLKRMLCFLLDHDCVVIVCAARLNRYGQPAHKTVDVVKQFCEDNGFKIKWIDKDRDRNDQADANRKVAAMIVEQVREAINALIHAGTTSRR
jgi:hypothetical protein